MIEESQKTERSIELIYHHITITLFNLDAGPGDADQAQNGGNLLAAAAIKQAKVIPVHFASRHCHELLDTVTSSSFGDRQREKHYYKTDTADVEPSPVVEATLQPTAPGRHAGPWIDSRPVRASRGELGQSLCRTPTSGVRKGEQ